MAAYIYRFPCDKEIEVHHQMAWVGSEPHGFFEGKVQGYEQMGCQCNKDCKAWRVPGYGVSVSKTYLEANSRSHSLAKVSGLYQSRKKNEARARRRLKK